VQDAASLPLAAELCEGVALQALAQHDVGKARLVLFEATPSRHFAQIKRLLAKSDQRWGEQLYNATACANRLTEWEELVRHRFELLAQMGVDDIHAYNAKAAYAEPIFYVVISGLGNVLGEPQRLAQLQTLCREGAAVGIVLLLLRNTAEEVAEPHLGDFHRKALQNFWGSIGSMVTGLDVREPQRPQPFNVPAELWQLLIRFGLQLGLGQLCQTWVDNLVAKMKSTDDAGERQDFLRVRIGLTGATPAFFSMGAKSLAYHAFIAGTNGSGKTTLLNNLILGACENYSPAQLQLTLMDFKFGISFNQYAGFAHIARLYAPLSPNYPQALSCLQQVAQEMEQRYKLLTEHSAQDIGEYNETAHQPLPPSSCHH
jgi:hypothetical protein